VNYDGLPEHSDVDHIDLKTLRREYASRVLDETATDADAIAQFRVWFSEALASQITDVNAMSLATATAAAEPSVRTVLLKDVDDRGFVFFTHHTSPKGLELAENPRAALLFYWAELERQVRITGSVTQVARNVSEAYFHSRPLDSQWAAWTAAQSTPIRDRATLEQRFEETKARFGGEQVPCPRDWGGYHVFAERIEFWQGRPWRLHDRILYTRSADGSWTRQRLAP
jgi:pyridoxamine 5'-phosphate oxidase